MLRDSKDGGERKPETAVQTRTADGAWMQRVDDDASWRQPSGEFLGKERARQLRLTIEGEWLVAAMAVEIVEQNALLRRLLNAAAARDDNDAACAVPHPIEQSIDQCEMTHVVDQELHLHSLVNPELLCSHDPGASHDDVQRPLQSTHTPYGLGHGVEVRQVTGNRGG